MDQCSTEASQQIVIPLATLRHILHCSQPNHTKTTVVIPKTRISKFRDLSNAGNISVSHVSTSVLRVALLPPIKESMNILRANIRSKVTAGPANSVGLIL